MTHLPTLPLLEALRPPPGWRVDRAILSTYSAEPTVIFALLLALAARDDDEGSGTRVDVARALTDLRGRVKFIVQRGRFAAPRKSQHVFALLDRFVREVPWDEGRIVGEAGKSWHAKLALVRLDEVDAKSNPQWRFWVGSRNFTRDTSWDIGMSLDSVSHGKSGGRVLSGIEQVATRLADYAGAYKSWQPLIKELSNTRWNVPRGLDIRQVSLLLPEDKARGFPTPPSNVKQMLAVAPYVDAQTIRELKNWVDQPPTLLSTIQELKKNNDSNEKNLEGVELLTLPETTETNESSPDEDDSQIDAILDNGTRGLHAKFLWARHRGGARLWLGSPNLTERAWRRNAEVFAEIEVQLRGGASAAKSLREGIEAFQGMARPIDIDELGALDPEDDLQKTLDLARNEVAARLSARQRKTDGVNIVEASGKGPHPEDSRISLHVGRLCGRLTEWPRGCKSIALGSADTGVDSDFLSVSVRLEDQSLSWTQLAPFNPPLLSTRDDAVLHDYVGVRGILSWIHDILDDRVDTDGGGRWDDEPRPKGKGQSLANSSALDKPTIEQALRAWIRDPKRLDAVDRVLRMATTNRNEPDVDPIALQHLQALSRSWDVLRAELKR